MLIHNLKTAFTQIVRHKTFSAINIIGLAISLTAVFYIGLYIENELSYDRFHTNAARIYRVADDKKTPAILLRSAASAAPVAPALQSAYPEITAAARILSSESLMSYGEKSFEERNIFFADNSIFDVFTFPMVDGNPAIALQKPNNIVITEPMAIKYFNTTSAVGKVLTVDGKQMSVTGVIKEIPSNAHFSFDFLISMSTAQQKGSGYDWLFTNWYSNNFYTYILLAENVEASQLSAKLGDFDRKHSDGTTSHGYSLEALTSIYLHSDRDNQVGKTGNLRNMYIFSAIAFFILLIACINFINLSTARAVDRAKEVGVKKAAGATRSALMWQFFTESFLTTAIGFLCAILLTALLLPVFNNFSGKTLSLTLSFRHCLAIIILLVTIGAMSGIYPALLLSGFKPMSALKGRLRVVGPVAGIRKGLVVFQFTASVILIICSMVIMQQLSYMQQHDLGFNSKQTLLINFEGDKLVQQKYQAIKEAMMRIPGVTGITASSDVPGSGHKSTWSMDFRKKTGDTVQTELPIFLVDPNFLSQYGVSVVAGRAFSTADSTSSMIINEAGLRSLGFTNAEDALGVKVGMYPSDATIIGVCKDFHIGSLKETISPLALRVLSAHFRYLSVSCNTSNIPALIASIEKTWKQLAPQRPIEYSFLDEHFNNQYNADIKFSNVIAIFTVLAILIAALGLFGLSLFTMRQRTREIGIRKVLGSGLAAITLLLSKDFLKLIIIAVFIAMPLAWLIVQKWLDNFAYRTPVNIMVFILAGCSAVIIGAITVSFHTLRSAKENPVNCLRSE